jgi:predicted anti-sigma-YlaC factor YlaD
MDREYGESPQNPIAAEAIDAHLAACPSCREFLQDIQAIHSSAQVEEPDPVLNWGRLQSSIDQAMTELAARNRRELFTFMAVALGIVAVTVGIGALSLRWFVVLQAGFFANASLILIPLLWQRRRKEGLS